MKSKVLTVLTTLIVGCATPMPMVKPTQADVDRAKTKWENADLASLQLGYTIYSEKCGNCHKLYRPAQFSEKKWLNVIPKMAAKANITDNEQQLIREYLLTMRENK